MQYKTIRYTSAIYIIKDMKCAEKKSKGEQN